MPEGPFLLYNPLLFLRGFVVLSFRKADTITKLIWQVRKNRVLSVVPYTTNGV